MEYIYTGEPKDLSIGFKKGTLLNKIDDDDFIRIVNGYQTQTYALYQNELGQMRAIPERLIKKIEINLESGE